MKELGTCIAEEKSVSPLRFPMASTGIEVQGNI
jgi:hypothetical protein